MIISIVVPIYNVEHELPRCFKSLVGQTYRDIEIVLVDDGSIDSCRALCDEYAAADSRARVIHKPNGGLSSARNAGRRVATGDYILYVDSDDWIETDACERLAQVAESTYADVIALEGVKDTPSGQMLMVHSNLTDGRVYSVREFVSLCITNREWFASACLYMYSSHMYRQADKDGDSLFFREGMLHEDMEMQPRLFSAAVTVAFCEGIAYHYVERSGSIMTGGWTQRRLDDMRLIYSRWKTVYEAEPNEAYRELLLGHFVKCWLTTCRVSGRSDALALDGMDWHYLFKYGLDGKEKAKALLYGISPTLFVKAGRLLK